jgi:hypothetical protein
MNKLNNGSNMGNQSGRMQLPRKVTYPFFARGGVDRHLKEVHYSYIALISA